MIDMTRDKIDNSTLVPTQMDPLSGATVLFLGTAREFTGNRQSESLEYDAYVDMATDCFAQLAGEARVKWPIHHLHIVHRLGHVELGETCVAVVVSCPHRREAFEAAAWLMDSIKTLVPIWKKEQWADGSSEWVHPSVAAKTSQTAGTMPTGMKDTP